MKLKRFKWNWNFHCEYKYEYKDIHVIVISFSAPRCYGKHCANNMNVSSNDLQK